MTNDFNKGVTEVLEIVKYLDDNLKLLIDNKYLEEIKKYKDNDYNFKINKNIPLYDNEFLDITYVLLARLFKKN